MVHQKEERTLNIEKVKTTKRIWIVSGLLAAFMLTACGEATKKNMKSASEHMDEAGEDLKQAASNAREENKAYVDTNWKEFQSESEEIIANTETQIKELRENIAMSAKKDSEKLSAELDKLEQKNKELKEKLAERSKKFKENLTELNEEAQEKQKSFDRELKHDLDELGTALKDIFKNNVE